MVCCLRACCCCCIVVVVVDDAIVLVSCVCARLSVTSHPRSSPLRAQSASQSEYHPRCFACLLCSFNCRRRHYFQCLLQPPPAATIAAAAAAVVTAGCGDDRVRGMMCVFHGRRVYCSLIDAAAAAYTVAERGRPGRHSERVDNVRNGIR